MFKFTVKRKYWLRGEGSDNSFLLRDAEQNEDMLMCCLGFGALACGYQEEDIIGAANPNDMVDYRPLGFFQQITEEIHELQEYKPNQKGIDLMATNDAESLSDTEREAKLTELFASIDVEVTFED